MILATGSRPRSLPGLTPDGKAILTSDEILELKQMPKSLIVIGAGAVGIEFASIFARFGATTTVIELLPARAAARGRGDLGRGGQAARRST